MVARRLIQTIVFLHYAAWSGAAVLTPPDIPEQPLIRTIYEWGDQIAVITERFQSTERGANELSVVDQSISRLVPIRAPGCDAYYDVAYDAGLGKLLLCGTGQSARVYRMNGASWTAVAEPVQGTEFRFAVNGNRIAIVSGNTVLLMSATSSDRPASIPLRLEMPPHTLSSALLLGDDVLLLAYDVGEFGGGLYRMDLKRPDKAPSELIDGNVKALARSKSGVVWAAGGLAHMGSLSAAIYRIDGDSVQVVAAIRGFNGRQGDKISKKAGVQFPGLTSVTGLALGKDDRPTMVFPEFGVFELVADRFNRLYEGRLRHSYQMPGYGVGSSPVGLAIAKSGAIFVADRSLGIFVLRKDGNRYSLKQLLFHD